MAQNSSVVAALQAQPVPADRQCVRNGTDIVNLVQDFVTVAGLASAVGGQGLQTNNDAAAALAAAQAAQAGVDAINASLPERRSSKSLVALPTGDSLVPLVWSPALASTTYEVRISLYGPSTHPAAYYGWHVVAGSQTTTSVNVAFDNIPAGWSMAWVVETLE